MRTERHDVAFIVGAVVGGLVAAGATLFRAPQSGAETRAQISERLEPVTAKTSGLTQTVATRSQSLTDLSVAKGKQLTATVKNVVQSDERPAQGPVDEVVVVEPLGTSDLEPLPAANAIPPVAPIEEDSVVDGDVVANAERPLVP